ncbi:hypothetical protein [Tamlana flava]|uniref:hypothetical protein n=1 Tax=Tamlana flava TaxID=3158572 RepID=UPI00351B5CFF
MPIFHKIHFCLSQLVRFLVYTFVLSLLSCQFTSKTKDTKQLFAESLSQHQSPQNKNNLDTILNTTTYLILGQKPDIVKVVKNTSISEYASFKVLAKYKDDVIVGRVADINNITIYRKFHPKTTFEDYHVEVYKGPLATPNFSTNPKAKQFITRIKEACAEGVNFAGHYTLVLWGCGTACQMGVVVNRKTGAISEFFDTLLGVEFKKDSNLIIKNSGAIDPATQLIELCNYCEVSQDIWTGTKFKAISE